MDKKKMIIIFNQNVALFFSIYFLARFNIYQKIEDFYLQEQDEQEEKIINKYSAKVNEN